MDMSTPSCSTLISPNDPLFSYVSTYATTAACVSATSCGTSGYGCDGTFNSLYSCSIRTGGTFSNPSTCKCVGGLIDANGGMTCGPVAANAPGGGQFSTVDACTASGNGYMCDSTAANDWGALYVTGGTYTAITALPCWKNSNIGDYTKSGVTKKSAVDIAFGATANNTTYFNKQPGWVCGNASGSNPGTTYNPAKNATFVSGGYFNDALTSAKCWSCPNNVCTAIAYTTNGAIPAGCTNADGTGCTNGFNAAGWGCLNGVPTQMPGGQFADQASALCYKFNVNGALAGSLSACVGITGGYNAQNTITQDGTYYTSVTACQNGSTGWQCDVAGNGSAKVFTGIGSNTNANAACYGCVKAVDTAAPYVNSSCAVVTSLTNIANSTLFVDIDSCKTSTALQCGWKYKCSTLLAPHEFTTWTSAKTITTSFNTNISTSTIFSITTPKPSATSPATFGASVPGINSGALTSQYFKLGTKGYVYLFPLDTSYIAYGAFFWQSYTTAEYTAIQAQTVPTLASIVTIPTMSSGFPTAGAFVMTNFIMGGPSAYNTTTASPTTSTYVAYSNGPVQFKKVSGSTTTYVLANSSSYDTNVKGIVIPTYVSSSGVTTYFNVHLTIP